MELNNLADVANRAYQVRQRLSRQQNIETGGGDNASEVASRPRSGRSVASFGGSYAGSAHSIRVVPVNGSPEMKFWRCGNKGIWSIIKMTLSLILFGFLNVFAFANYFVDVKLVLIKMLYEQTLIRYLNFGYETMCLVEACFLLAFVTNDTPFSELLNYVRELENQREDKDQLTSTGMVKFTTFCLITSSIFSAILFTMDCGGGTAGVMAWGVKKWLLEVHAYYLAIGLFVWTPSGYEKSTEWRKQYTTMTPINVSLGSIDVLLAFSSNLYTFIIQDLVLSNTITFYLEIKAVAKICEPFARSASEAEAQVRGILKSQELGKRFNRAFGTLIRAAIVYDLFLFTFLLWEVLEKETFALVNTAFFINAIKATVFLALATKIHDYGQVQLLCAKRLRDDFGEHIMIDGEQISLIGLVRELEAQPIGVGKDAFLINEFFLMSFIGGVFGFFGLLAAARMG